jgi:HYR domain
MNSLATIVVVLSSGLRRNRVGRAAVLAAVTLGWIGLTDSSPVRATTHLDVVVGIHAPTSVEATGPDGAAVSYSVDAAHNYLTWTAQVEGELVNHCSPASGSTFALGVNTISCAWNNVELCAEDACIDFTFVGQATVTVVDTTPPVVPEGGDITVEATGPAGAVIGYGIPPMDVVDQSVDVACTPASGSQFALGDTSASCTATDDAGNSATTPFVMHVVDTTAPTLNLPSGLTAQATGRDGAIVDYAATAHDLVAGDVPVRCTPPPGSLFPLGDTVVTCTASDGGTTPAGFFGESRPRQVASGNVATGTFTVTVAQQISTTTTDAATTTTDAATTTTDAATTTTDAATAPTTTDPATLPATGTSAGPVAATATACLAAGLALLAAVRR